jgi:hypothetical protein
VESRLAGDCAPSRATTKGTTINPADVLCMIVAGG